MELAHQPAPAATTRLLPTSELYLWTPACSQLAVLKDFAPELVWCGAVRGAIPFITYAAQENDDLTLTTSSMTIIVK